MGRTGGSVGGCFRARLWLWVGQLLDGVRAHR
jgi:hypothetical protein